MQKGLNIRHMLIVALGYNERLHEEIDKMYEERRWEYYETFKNSGFYDDMVIKSFSPIRHEKMQKVAGMIEWAYNNNDKKIINRLIKKGYNNVLRYYESNKNRLNLHAFSEYITKKSGKKLGELKEIELSMYQLILVYIATKDGFNVSHLFSDPYGKLCLRGIESITLELLSQRHMKDYLEKSEEAQKETTNFINDALGIDIDKVLPTTVDLLLDFSIERTIEKNAKAKGVTAGIGTVNDYNKIRHELFNTGIHKFIGGYATVLKNTELNYVELVDVEITKEELMALALNSIQRKEGNQFSDEDIQQFFVASLYIHGIVQQYKKQKEVFVDDSNEAWYVDVQNREKQLQQKERFYEKMKDNLESQLESTETKMNSYKSENEEMKKELKRLREQLSSMQEDKDELVELRNFAYSQQQLDIEIDNFDIEKVAAELNNKKLIICGGHPNMLRKIKEWLPNVETMDTDTLNKSLTYLKSYDTVFFYPNYANHSFYKKIKNAIKNTKVNFVYLPDVDNLEIIISKMHNSIKTNPSA